MTQAAKAQVDEVLYVPAALALHQRPGVPGIRSTFGTGHGAAEQPASDVFPPGQPPLPERALPAAVRWPWPPGRSSSARECGAHFLRAFRRGTGLQQPGRLPHLRRHGRGTHGGPRDAGAGREPDHRRGSGRALELADVVADDRRLPGDGRAHGRALSRSDGRGKGHRLQRPGGKRSTFSTRPKIPTRPAELDFTYYNAVYTVENALCQGQGRKGHEARGKIFEAGYLPRLRRHAPVRGGARAAAARHLAGRGLPNDAWRSWSNGCAGVPDALAGGNAPHGGEHLRIVSDGGQAADGSGAGLSGARPRRRHAFHRRAAAHAAGPRRAQPHHRRALCAGRALHRPAPLQHRRADRA